MKRFLSFGGATHYAGGGMNDFIGSFETITQALEGIEEWKDKEGWRSNLSYWCHIWDCVENKCIHKFNEACHYIENPLC